MTKAANSSRAHTTVAAAGASNPQRAETTRSRFLHSLDISGAHVPLHRETTFTPRMISSEKGPRDLVLVELQYVKRLARHEKSTPLVAFLHLLGTLNHPNGTGSFLRPSSTVAASTVTTPADWVLLPSDIVPGRALQPAQRSWLCALLPPAQGCALR